MGQRHKKCRRIKEGHDEQSQAGKTSKVSSQCHPRSSCVCRLRRRGAGSPRTARDRSRKSPSRAHALQFQRSLPAASKPDERNRQSPFPGQRGARGGAWRRESRPIATTPVNPSRHAAIPRPPHRPPSADNHKKQKHQLEQNYPTTQHKQAPKQMLALQMLAFDVQTPMSCPPDHERKRLGSNQQYGHNLHMTCPRGVTVRRRACGTVVELHSGGPALDFTPLLEISAQG
jgi:hypothetical protein